MAQVKVLVIDDDEGMTELLELLLSPTSTILIANTGSEGVELARKCSPDIIILDLMMPGMDGWEVCRAIREFSRVPILILSALDSSDIAAAALDAGADDFLTKPVSTATLLARLNRLLKRSHISSPSLYAAGPA